MLSTVVSASAVCWNNRVERCINDDDDDDVMEKAEQPLLLTERKRAIARALAFMMRLVLESSL